MSWIIVTALIALAFFACTYGLCEWLAGGSRSSDGDDHSAMG